MPVVPTHRRFGRLSIEHIVEEAWRKRLSTLRGMFCPKCGKPLVKIAGTRGALRQSSESREQLTCIRGEMFISERLEELLIEWCAASPASSERPSEISDGLRHWFCPLDGQPMVIDDHDRPRCLHCQRTLAQPIIYTLVEIQPHNDW